MTVYYTVARRAANTRAAKDEQRQRVFPFLLQKLDLDPHQPIKKDKNGRPFLPVSPTSDISLSHADLFTAYAAGDTRIGIDMESPADIRNPEAICHRFFTEAEQKQVQSSSDVACAVCEIWTKKEALAKYIGNGLSKNLHQDTTNPQKEVIFHSFSTTFAEKPYIITICVHPDTHITFLDPKCFKF